MFVGVSAVGAVTVAALVVVRAVVLAVVVALMGFFTAAISATSAAALRALAVVLRVLYRFVIVPLLLGVGAGKTILGEVTGVTIGASKLFSFSSGTSRLSSLSSLLLNTVAAACFQVGTRARSLSSSAVIALVFLAIFVLCEW